MRTSYQPMPAQTVGVDGTQRCHRLPERPTPHKTTERMPTPVSRLTTLSDVTVQRIIPLPPAAAATPAPAALALFDPDPFVPSSPRSPAADMAPRGCFPPARVKEVVWSDILRSKGKQKTEMPKCGVIGFRFPSFLQPSPNPDTLWCYATM